MSDQMFIGGVQGFDVEKPRAPGAIEKAFEQALFALGGEVGVGAAAADMRMADRRTGFSVGGEQIVYCAWTPAEQVGNLAGRKGAMLPKQDALGTFEGGDGRRPANELQ
ncbi:hypothetical protein GCM10011586_21420 [Silvibacterium dinghuense]|nr:hypothetical protein GCM10011586_21420 [Silvibacterium dinghuense]